MQRSDGGGTFQAVDMLNGKSLCGCDDVQACVVRLIFIFGLMERVHSSLKVSDGMNRWKARISIYRV